MTLSFFRKKEPKPQPKVVAQKSSVLTGTQPIFGRVKGHPAAANSTSANSSAPIERFSQMPEDAYSINESENDEIAIADEAAVFFANGQEAQAVDILIAGLGPQSGFPAHRANKLAWLMLLWLYQNRGDQIAFEKLAIDYAMQFECSPPVFQQNTEALRKVAVNLPLSMQLGRPLVLANHLGANDVRLLEDWVRLNAAQHTLGVDTSRLISVDLEGATLFYDVLRQLRKQGKRVQIKGHEALETTLAQVIEETLVDAEIFWLLQLEYLQSSNREEDFEKCALDYAITFEISPPSWEALPELKPAAVINSKDEANPSSFEETPRLDNEYELKGIMLGAADHQLQKMGLFGQRVTELHINMKTLVRMDFVCAGFFITVVSNLSRSGKKIKILDSNPMITALLQVMGVPQYAEVIPLHI